MIDLRQTTSVLLVDDHPLIRKGLVQLVELDDELVIAGEASSGEEGLLIAIEKEPDLILLDLNMKGMDGIATLVRIREQGLASRVIMLTVSDNEEDVISAISAGADGYLLKDMDPGNILQKIKQAATGAIVVSEELTNILAGAIRQGDSLEAGRIEKMTVREKETLLLLGKGLSNKLIAQSLGISDGTVKVHVRHILKKLELKSRVEVALWVSKNARLLGL